MKKFILLMLIVSMAFTFSACDNGDNDGSPSTEQDMGQTIELTVWGMTCNRCENRIKNALSDMDGIISVSADFRTDTVIIEHDSEYELDIEAVKSVITAMGFNIP